MTKGQKETCVDDVLYLECDSGFTGACNCQIQCIAHFEQLFYRIYTPEVIFKNALTSLNVFKVKKKAMEQLLFMSEGEKLSQITTQERIMYITQVLSFNVCYPGFLL